MLRQDMVRVLTDCGFCQAVRSREQAEFDSAFLDFIEAHILYGEVAFADLDLNS